MGLDAFVPCNCFKEGKTSEPPVDREWIIQDEGYYSLNPLYSKDMDLDNKIYKWSQNCCEHPFMHISERISNWSGIRLFQQAMNTIGIDNFPILNTELPDVNGGYLTVENAKKALAELDIFEKRIVTINNIYLINVDSGEAVYEYIDAYDGKVIFSKPYSLGFNINGLYIVESDSNKILFQGKSVQQKVYYYPQWLKIITKITPIKLRPIRKVCWIDTATKNHFYTKFGLSIYNGNYPKEFTIKEQPTDIFNYQYIIDSLRKMFEASIQMNNPVYWC